MISPSPKFRAVDLFCGAGGMTLGAEQSRAVDVVLAVNHWQTAIFTHETNHPNIRHICARVEDMDMRNEHDLPEIDMVMGGIECVHHSNARGAAPINDQRRTSGWRVIDWIERFRPAWCVFENVREFEKWGPIDENGRKIKSRAGEIFNAWVGAIRSHGYHVEWKILNAAEFGEATKRLRLFIVCRRGESHEPFKWPEPTHADKDTIEQQLREQYRANRLRERTAAEIIDWSRPCPSIFSRKRPLADKTLRRIEIGLKKFVEPYLVYLKGSSTAKDIRGPLGTIQTGGHWALAQPFVIQYHSGRCESKWKNRIYSTHRPLPTLDTQPRYAVARPFFMQRQGFFDSKRDKPPVTIERPLNTITASHSPGHLVVPFTFDIHNRRVTDTSRSLMRPFPTIVAKPGNSLVMPYLVQVNHGGHDYRTRPVTQALNTITTKRGHAAIFPFLTKYYGTAGAVPVTRPLDTVTTKDRYALTQVMVGQHAQQTAPDTEAMASLKRTMLALGVADIGFRMLDVDELAAAQGFPTDYYLHGTKADQIRQVGNAVYPGVMKALCEAIANQ